MGLGTGCQCRGSVPLATILGRDHQSLTFSAPPEKRQQIGLFTPFLQVYAKDGLTIGYCQPGDIF